MMARNAKATKIFMDPIISPAQARFGWRFWLLTLAALVAMAVTATLGAWQLSRAAQKQALQAMLVAREQMPVLVGRDLERARVGGVQLLSPATIERIFDCQSDNVDLVLGVPERFGLGYGLPCEGMPFGLDAKICFWGGWGGSMIVNDLERGMTVAYMMNKMEAGLVGDTRGFDLIAAAYGALD